MKKVILGVLGYSVIITALLTINAHANRVNGYYRSNGTYVAPYERSAPDNTRSNNYGVGSGNYQQRDQDNDGVPNYRDNDDNGNGVSDDNERYYRRR